MEPFLGVDVTNHISDNVDAFRAFRTVDIEAPISVASDVVSFGIPNGKKDGRVR